MLEATIKEKIFEASENPSELIFRILSWLLTSIFFANIPILLFLVYMFEHGFFSYDFFSEGVFGLKTFFFLTGIMIVFISFLFFAFLFPLIKRVVIGKYEHWIKQTVLALFFNVLILIFFGIIVFLEKWEPLLFLYVASIGVFIIGHVAFLVYAKPSQQLRSLAISMGVIITMSTIFHKEHAAFVLGASLRTFGMGGGIESSIIPKISHENAFSGKLLLLSPKHIYIQLNDSADISILERTRFDIIKIKKKITIE